MKRLHEDWKEAKQKCEVCGGREYLAGTDEQGRRVCGTCYHAACERMLSAGAYE